MNRSFVEQVLKFHNDELSDDRNAVISLKLCIRLINDPIVCIRHFVVLDITIDLSSRR